MPNFCDWSVESLVRDPGKPGILENKESILENKESDDLTIHIKNNMSVTCRLKACKECKAEIRTKDRNCNVCESLLQFVCTCTLWISTNNITAHQRTELHKFLMNKQEIENKRYQSAIKAQDKTIVELKRKLHLEKKEKINNLRQTQGLIAHFSGVTTEAVRKQFGNDNVTKLFIIEFLEDLNKTENCVNTTIALNSLRLKFGLFGYNKPFHVNSKFINKIKKKFVRAV